MFINSVFSKRALMGLALAVPFATASAQTVATAKVTDPMTRPAAMVRAPAKAYLTGLARAGQRLVAVGERGIIVLSSDGGASWRQVAAPTSVTLAAVHFPTPTHGWAVGHYGVILHSTDGGETWSRQLDGVQAAKLVLQDAQTAATQGGDGRYLAEAQRLANDGPDKPFLGLHFTDKYNGYVVGAYNLAFSTRDGGKTWRPLMSQLDNPRGSHLYAVHAAGNAIYITGEQGVLLRSIDGGGHFERVDTGYKGSFFAMTVGPGGDVVVAGLRGNAYRSSDQGTTWHKLDVPVPVSITAATLRADGSLVLANQAGQLLTADAGGSALSPLKTPGLPGMNDLLVQPDGGIVATTMFGAIRLPAATLATTVSPNPMAAK